MEGTTKVRVFFPKQQINDYICVCLDQFWVPDLGVCATRKVHNTDFEHS